MWLRKGPVIAALYPVGMLLVLQLALAVALGHGCGPVWRAGSGPSGPWRSGRGLASGLSWRWRRACRRLWPCCAGSRRKDGKLFAYYLMHDYAYSAQSRGAYPPELEQRMAHFGDAIAAALTTDVDEVLVVGHSSGAHLAVSILSDLIRAGRVPPTGPHLALLSLGQVVPMVSFPARRAPVARRSAAICRAR